jgi:hypothetical protein
MLPCQPPRPVPGDDGPGPATCGSRHCGSSAGIGGGNACSLASHLAGSDRQPKGRTPIRLSMHSLPSRTIWRHDGQLDVERASSEHLRRGVVLPLAASASLAMIDRCPRPRMPQLVLVSSQECRCCRLGSNGRRSLSGCGLRTGKRWRPSDSDHQTPGQPTLRSTCAPTPIT